MDTTTKGKTLQENQEADKDALGGDQVQEKVDEAEDKGYMGEVPDQTPNEHYTVDGVTSGKPTPENPEGLTGSNK